MSNNEQKVRVPTVPEGGEMCGTIPENTAETDGATVFEDPEALVKGLGAWWL